jgi:hypothetical protein
MKIRRLATDAAALALVIVLMGSGTAFAANATPLSLTVPVGTVLNAGDQHYTVDNGPGATWYAMVDGYYIDQTSGQLQYTLTADVHGVDAGGNAHIQLTGLAVSTTTGATTPIDVEGQIRISSMLNPVYMPLGCTPPPSPPAPQDRPPHDTPNACNSAIPSFFQGNTNLQVTLGSTQPSPHEDGTPQQKQTMMLESPYLNPFGMPIIIASADGSVTIVTTYSVGTIQWTNTRVGGAFGPGSVFGTTPVTGNFNLTSTENENLVTGVATDHGQMYFQNMAPSSLDARGVYKGTSTIPTAGSIDCSSTTGIPGTCTETGFQSSGQFTLQPQPAPHSEDEGAQPRYSITGTYSTTWTVPALTFSSTTTATVSSH